MSSNIFGPKGFDPLAIKTPYVLTTIIEFSDGSDGGWNDNIGSPGNIVVESGYLSLEQTADFGGDPMIVLESNLPNSSLGMISQCGHVFVQVEEVLLDSRQGEAADFSFNTVGIGFRGAGSPNGMIAIGLVSDGDGAGDASVSIAMSDLLSGKEVTPFPLGGLNGLGPMKLRLEIIQAGPFTFDVIGYSQSNLLEWVKIGDFRGLVAADYGFDAVVLAGVQPLLLSMGDVETTPHVHRVSSVQIFNLPASSNPDGPRPIVARQTDVGGDVLTTDTIILVTDTSIIHNFMLPAASDWPGRHFILKNTTAGIGPITITAQPLETVDGAPMHTLSGSYNKVHIYSNGVSWFTI